MWSLNPRPDNSWPRGMVITIEDDLQQVMDLLWVREAYGLQPAGDVPPLLVDTPQRSGSPDDVPGGEAAWAGLWQTAVAHAGSVDTRGLIERLHSTELASDERAELLTALSGPSWRERFGDAALGEPHQAWAQRRFHERAREHRRPLAETPERRSLPALIRAWEVGLVRIVTIPCAGEHTRRISDSALLVTEETRDDPGRFTAALNTFR